jgi:L-ascorbate metabolism protein UlaG (beta-lactamase superfamily)
MPVTVTRIAHSTVLIDFDGHRILTDPWFSERFGYYHGEPYGITLADLPRLDGVVVTHDHYDHFDLGAFRAYPERAVPMVVKRGLGEKAPKARFTDVREVDAWESTTVGSVQVTATPGKHGVPEVTFVLAASGRIIFFGGDTLLIPELREVGRRFPSVDLALLPVNGLVLRPMFNRQVVMNGEGTGDPGANPGPGGATFARVASFTWR